MGSDRESIQPNGGEGQYQRQTQQCIYVTGAKSFLRSELNNLLSAARIHTNFNAHPWSLVMVGRSPGIFYDLPVKNETIYFLSRSSSYRAVKIKNINTDINTNILVLNRTKVAVCSVIRTKHTNTLCGQNAEC